MKPGTPPLQSSRLPDQLREAKVNKDRVVMWPRSLVPAMRMQLLAARAVWEADRQAQRGGVETPHAPKQGGCPLPHRQTCRSL